MSSLTFLACAFSGMACLLQVVMSTAAEVLLLASEAQPEPVSHSHPLSAVPGRPAADSTGGEPQRSSSAVAHSVAAAVSRVTGGAAEPETDNEGALKNEHGVITAVQAVMDSLLAATSKQTAACCTPAPHSTPAAEDLAVPEPDALCAPMDIDVEEDDGAVPAEEAICEPAAAAAPACSAETAATRASRSCEGSERDLTSAATFGDGRRGIARLRMYCSAHAGATILLAEGLPGKPSYETSAAS